MDRCRIYPVLCLLFLWQPWFQVASHANELTGCQNVPPIFKDLADKLVGDGFDQLEICTLFSNRAVRFDPHVMPQKVTHDENKLHYDIFLEKERIARARRFLAKNRKLLSAIERDYGIPKEIKVAILLVETDLGRYLGSGLAFNTLASMAVADDFSRVRDFLPSEYNSLNKRELKSIKIKMARKSEWAYSELKSLILYSKLNNLDMFKIKGSVFGAIGLCQFMPSNALRFGVDYDKDGKVDLFEPADALASMANYLKYYGWKQDIARSRQLRVIMHYNHSKPYARTVIKVADRVKTS